MKKILCLLFAMLCLFTLVACKGAQSETPTATQPEEEQRSNVVETDENGQTYYLLADFENYYEASQLGLFADFGTMELVSRQEQPDMVTNGETSAHITISGNESSWLKRRPNLRISTTTGFFNYTTDFSNMEYLALDVYNCQDYEVEIRFYVNPSIDANNTMEDRYATHPNNPYNIVYSVILQPQQWNNLKIPAEEFKQVAYDDSGKRYMKYGADALEAVGGFHITFDRGELHENPQQFYIDNVRAYIQK
ncbi:MAG: hypothetical protein IJZ48_06355 [Oscillospiraceae bacterium]|nr:hypothetical protein [Oscillospiraceae bacterium]